MHKFVQRFSQDTTGATAIEYGLIADLIAVAIITAVSGLGSALSSKFSRVSVSVNTATH